ncbi:unnamed protein product [Bursaphelenchus xylophilus]|uniref:(pine wood nematode) hypothetical protein n=1 Tax=Bursaphelenchus xylophilus TaxID=6326 RepID=A0A7I8WTL5_BURXY|nr:unnamed protein product [Bursaphelenchus xylophilus]CAG9116155.1 unnamed protein product [Bursaphelenchus xylophilus]
MELFETPLYNGRVFENPRSFNGWKGLPGLRDIFRWRFVERNESHLPSQAVLNHSLPVQVPQFDFTSKLSATWLGHATVFVRLEGISFITDPVWTPRASPFRCIGPFRYRPPPCDIDDLPPLHFGVISHNHYDHLDADAVSTLSAKFPDMEWFVPKGLSDWMRRHVCNNVIHEMTWGESVTLALADGKYQIWCIPAQHWSSRNLVDKNKSLWCGWAIIGMERKFYFAGDTGFCETEFAKLGNNLGPFDLAAIPIGAYSPRWFMKSQHVDPEEAVRMHKLIKAVTTIGIHWGTYKMGSTESYLEPRSKLRQAVEKAGLSDRAVLTLDHGETWTEDPNSRYSSVSSMDST